MVYPVPTRDLSTAQPKSSHALCTLPVHPTPPHLPPFFFKLHPIINEVSILSPRKKFRCQKWRSLVQAQKTAHSCQRREKWPNKGFLQPSQEAAILFSSFGCTHPVPPFLLEQNLCRKDVGGNDITNSKSQLQLKSLAAKGLS